MTKILSEKIETLSPEKQDELLKYIELLATQKQSNRMTMDKRQNVKLEKVRNVEEQTSFIHYTIW
jgi:ABC-type transporter MlaC component